MNHVLVVDDDPPTLEMMELVLGLAGHRVSGVGSAAEALSTAQRDRPEALLVDVMLPGMTGLELLAELRGAPETADVPVLLVSAMAGDLDEWSALAAGANGYLPKPLDVDDLVAEVHRMVADGPEGTRPDT